ncbi:MAG: ATP-binding cassette domain-containing protein [Verrucomicrobia bacterium]|nr:ATP-binding cassette domain-containing protein [Verrucomicrobiota bacterium]
MIQIENLWKRLGGLEVFKGVSFEVQKGEFLALIGMSGTGKSVLLKHIAGLMKPDRGRILVDGTDVTRASFRELEDIRSRFGFVFQNGALFDSMTVFDNVAFPLREKTRMTESKIADRVRHDLEQVGLGGAEEKYPSQLSGGMIKRAALARALVRDPEIVFFDEPTTGLDPIIAKSILRLFDSFHNRLKLTGVLVSHDIPDIFGIVQKVAMLHDGELVALEEAKNIQSCSHPVVDQFIHGRIDGPIRYR